MIPFKGKVYPALVKVRKEGTDLCCSIRYIESGIHFLLPVSNIRYCLQKGIVHPVEPFSKSAQIFIEKTMEAVMASLEIKHPSLASAI